MADIRLKDFPVKSTVSGNDKTHIADSVNAGEDAAVEIKTIKGYVLNDASIGGVSPGDIVTTTAQQDMSNKKLIDPKVNSSTPVTATSEDINKLKGASVTTNDLNKLASVTATAGELNTLVGATGNMQSQIDGMAAQYSIGNMSFGYTANLVGGSKYVISESNLRGGVEGITGINQYRVDPRHVSIKIWSIAGGVYSDADIDGSYCEFNTKVYHKTTVLDQIDVSVGGRDVLLVVNFRLIRVVHETQS